jgi:hypothetical protein
VLLWQKNFRNIYHAYDKPLLSDLHIKSLCKRTVSVPGPFGNRPADKSECCLICIAREAKIVQTSGDIDI